MTRYVVDADGKIFRPQGLVFRLHVTGDVKSMEYMDMSHSQHADKLPPQKNNGERSEFLQDLRQAAKRAEEAKEHSLLSHKLEGREIAHQHRSNGNASAPSTTPTRRRENGKGPTPCYRER